MPRSRPAADAAPRRSQRSTPKVQRWVDLLADLLMRTYPATFEEIAAGVPAYADTSKDLAARLRMFERDKDELRAYGVPLETVEDEDEQPSRYRIAKKSFYLPYLSLVGSQARASSLPNRYGYRDLPRLAFEPDELAAIGEAAARARALGDPVLAAHAESGVRKLAFDLPMDAVAGDETHLVPVRARAEPEVLAALGDALRARKRVRFDYRSMGRDATERRDAEPWGLFFLNGHWYLAARDVARDDGEARPRNFRVSRIRDVRMNDKRAQTPDYAVPADFRLRDHARSRQSWELGDGDGEPVVVSFRETGATASALGLGEPVPGAPHHRRFVVRRRDAFLRWLLAFAGDAHPASPESFVRDWCALVERTRAVYATGADATGVDAAAEAGR